MSSKVIELGQAVTFLDSMRRPIKASERRAGAYPYYGANGQQGTIDGYIFDEPLVLLAEDGGYFDQPARGIAYLVEGKCWVNNHAHVLRANKDFLPAYLTYSLKHRDVRPYITGTTRAKLTKSDAARIPVKVLSISEQRRIVDILDRAAAIQKLRRQAEAKAHEIIPALFVDMFGDPATNPREWPVKQLEDVADIGSGATKGRKLAGKQTVLVPYLRVANVQDGFLSLNEIKEIEIQETEREKYGLRVGDLVMTEGGDLDKLGRGFIWEGQLPYCAHQNHVFRVRVNGELLDPYFLSHLIQSWHGKSYFLRVAKRTTGIASINKTQLGRLPVWLPPLSMQQEFASQVSDLSAMIARQKQGTACVASLQSALAERVLANV